MKFEYYNDETYNLFNFDFDMINELEIYLKNHIKGQNEPIESIIRILKNNTIRTNKKPITMLFSGASGVGKSLTVRLISEFLNKNIGGDDFKLYTIDMTKYYANEVSSWFGTSPGFSGSNEPSLFENISGLLYSKENIYNSAVIYINEIDKMKVNRGENALDVFFKTTMSLFNDNIHFFKSGRMEHISIDLSNVIFILDGNFINDRPEEEVKRKIGFTEEENNKNQNLKNYENKKDKEKLINFLGEQIPISSLNRLNYCNDSIIQFNEIGDDVIYSIFETEYKKLIESMSNNSNYKDFFKEYLFKPQEYYKKMLSKLSKKNGARGISNFVQYDLKNDIIDKIIIDYDNYKKKKKKTLS